MRTSHVGVSKSPSGTPMETCSANAAPVGVGEDHEWERLAAPVCISARNKYFC